MVIYLQCNKGNKYKLELFMQRQDVVDLILDNINIGMWKNIPEHDFYIKHPMVIDIIDEREKKIGQLTCSNICLSVNTSR